LPKKENWQKRLKKLKIAWKIITKLEKEPKIEKKSLKLKKRA
jgi:hypothetical protein